jgi:hypothetical protein
MLCSMDKKRSIKFNVVLNKHNNQRISKSVQRRFNRFKKRNNY